MQEKNIVQKFSRDQFIAEFSADFPEVYQKFVDGGYGFWASSPLDNSDGLCKKKIKDDNGNTLFVIDCRVWIYDKERFAAVDKPFVSCCVEVFFYVEDNDDKYCCIKLNTQDLAWAEQFFRDFFYRNRCRIYEKSGE
jgi:hypothetical protein